MHPVLADAPETELSGAARPISVLGSLAAVLVGAPASPGGSSWPTRAGASGWRRGFLGARSVLNRAWLFDEIYDATVVAPTRELGDTLAAHGRAGRRPGHRHRQPGDGGLGRARARA